ncbi:MAG TPA: hypothetical protein EYP85_06970, partial [Armatimonadetes bacterium]|nr:hypothetical protein [Armatimonadota bacterium]
MSRKVICGILMLGLLSMGITGRVGMAEAPPSADERPSAQTPSAAEGTPQVDGFRIEEEEGVVRLRVRLSAPVERIEARFLKAAEYQVLIPARLGELPAPAVTVARGAVADALFQPGKEGRSTQILLRLNQPAPCRAYLAAEGREVIVEAQAPRVPPLPPRPPASLGVVTRGPDRLTLDFVDTPLTDILAALAVASGRNVVVTKAVQGRATVHLTEVSFSTALELITKSNGLTYREVEGCYVVGTPEELEKETTAPEVRLVSLPEERLAEAEELLSKVWPDLTLATQPPTTLVLVGPRDLVRQAQSLLTKLPLPSPPVPPVVDTLRLQHAEAETVARVLTQALPQAKVEAQPAQRTVVVVGTAAQVRRARQLLPALDVPPVPAPEPPRAAAVVTLRYLSAETVQKVLPAALPQVTVEAEKQAVVVVGPPEALQQAQSLIAALDVAPAPPPTPPTETPVAAAPAAPSPPARTLAVLRLQQADPEAVRRVLSQLLPKATFEVDTAAKTVLMVGPEADIARARAWLKELDLAPPPAPEPKRTEVVRVQHVEATRVQQWLAQALPEVRVVADPEMPVLLLTGP